MFTHERRTRASVEGRQRAVFGLPLGRWLLGALMLVAPCAAGAHGIVGNRVFPGTLAFDDPAVMDELIAPAFSRLEHPGEGGDVVDDRIGWSFSRLLTSTVSFGIESGWMHRDWGQSRR